MHTRNILKMLPACILAVVLIGTGISPVIAQERLQVSPGGYHGELDFPISWKRYYTYDEWTQIMHDMQDQYSGLADIESIGTSRMGREQYLMTITAKSAGRHDEKPAMWVDGAVHGCVVSFRDLGSGELLPVVRRRPRRGDCHRVAHLPHPCECTEQEYSMCTCRQRVRKRRGGSPEGAIG